MKKDAVLSGKNEAASRVARRDFLRTAGGAALSLALGGATRLKAQEAAAAPARPNLLWITMEDTCHHFIGCYGDRAVHTPNLDRLAAQGVRFNRAFSTAPVCSPSRSAIITGCLADALGSGQHRSACPIPASIKGFPEYLRAAGYYTSNNDKLDYNFAQLPAFVAATWNESSNQAGWWKRPDPAQPFFSVFNLMSSHQSRTMTAPRRWYEEKVLGKLPVQNQTSPDAITVPPFFRDTPAMRQHLSRVHNSINLADLEIGQLLDRLTKEGLADDTIVFCFADHGEGIPKGKSSAVGLGFQIPFFIYFPPKYQHLSPWPAGQPTEELISSSEDVAPTVLSLAGLEIPASMTGRALAGGARKEPRPYVWGSRNRIDESPDLSRCVTDGTYFYTRVFMPQLPLVKYQKYADVSDLLREIRADHQAGLLNRGQAELLKPTQPIEYLFHLPNDPWQMQNLAGDSAHAAQLETMRAKLEEHLLTMRDILFMPEYEMVERSAAATPYEFRMDAQGYPFEQVLAAALLVGKGPGVLPQQLALLQHADATVRYWGAVGLDAQGDAIKPFAKEITAGLDDPHPSVQIALAGLACKRLNSVRAAEILRGFVASAKPLAKLHALQQILYLEEQGRPFVPDLRLALQTEKQVDLHDILDETLHFLEGDPLYYQDTAQWAPPEQLAPDPTIHFST